MSSTPSFPVYIASLYSAKYVSASAISNLYNVFLLHVLGLLAKNAVEAGLTVKPYIKTSLSPGSGVVTYYLRDSGVMPYLAQLGYVSLKALNYTLLCILAIVGLNLICPPPPPCFPALRHSQPVTVQELELSSIFLIGAVLCLATGWGLSSEKQYAK